METGPPARATEEGLDRSRMLLNPGERILFQDQVQRPEDGYYGLLILTNLRLVFETNLNRGLIQSYSPTAVHEVDMEVWLQHLVDVQVEDHLLGRLSLLLTLPSAHRRFRTPSAQGWRELIIRARDESLRAVQLAPPAPVPMAHSRPSHAGRNLAAVAIVVLLFLAFGEIVPIPHPFSGDVQAVGTPVSGLVVNASTGSTVHGTWSSSGGPIVMIVLDNSGAQIFSSSGVTGDFIFTSTSPPILIAATSLIPTNVHIDGSYDAPLFRS